MLTYLSKNGIMCQMKKILIIILISLLLTGCSFEDKRVVVKPEPVDNRDRWLVLAPYIKEYFDTGDMTVEEIAAELAWAEYKLSLE